MDGVEDDGEREADDGQFDPADYTDHLYDSDGGSAQQSQNFRQQTQLSTNTNPTDYKYLRASAPHQPTRPQTSTNVSYPIIT